MGWVYSTVWVPWYSPRVLEFGKLSGKRRAEELGPVAYTSKVKGTCSGMSDTQVLDRELVLSPMDPLDELMAETAGAERCAAVWWYPGSYAFFLLCFCFGAGDGAQGLLCARQVPYQ